MGKRTYCRYSIFLLGHKKEQVGKASQISFSIGCEDFGGLARVEPGKKEAQSCMQVQIHIPKVDK